MGGLGHDLKAGVNFIHEPRLYVTFSSGSADYAYTHLDQRPQRPDQPRHAQQAGRVGQPADGPVRLLHPGRLARDRPADRQCRPALRPRHRLPDRSVGDSQLRRADRRAAAAGRFDGVPGFDEFGKKAQEDKNNWQPRIGAVLRPPRRRPRHRPRRLGHLLRLRLHERQHPVPGPERAGRIRRRVRREQHRAASRTRTAASSGSASRSATSPRSNEVNPNGPFYSSNVAAPQIRQPLTSQTSVGWSHEFSPTTVLDVDYVHPDGQGPRRALAAEHAHPVPGGAAPLCRSGAEPGQPDDEHEHRRVAATTASTSASAAAWTNGIQLNAWYTLSKADGPRRPGGRRADDEPGAGLDATRWPTCSSARRPAPTRGTRSR